MRAIKKIGHFPKNMNSNYASLLSYITFDGHLAVDLSNFYLSSKEIYFLSRYRDFLKKEFGLSGKFEVCRDGYGESYKYRVFN